MNNLCEGILDFVDGICNLTYNDCIDLDVKRRWPHQPWKTEANLVINKNAIKKCEQFVKKKILATELSN